MAHLTINLNQRRLSANSPESRRERTAGGTCGTVGDRARARVRAQELLRTLELIHSRGSACVGEDAPGNMN